MNEVRPVQTVSPVSTRPASSKGASDQNSETVGNSLPPAAENTTPEKVEKTEEVSRPEDLQKAVASINDFVQSVQRDLQFTVDDELEKTVIKVVDGYSGEVIRQIPEEVFLDLARKLNDNGEFQLIDALG